MAVYITQVKGEVLREGDPSVCITQVKGEVLRASEAAGWTGKICGVTNPAKINGIAVANISKVCGV